MLDIKMVREQPDMVERMLKSRNVTFPLEQLLEADRRRRSLITEAQRLKELRNKVSREVATLKKEGGDTSAIVHEIREISNRIDEANSAIRKLQDEVEDLLLRLPNMLHESVPVGPDESSDLELRRRGEPKVPKFDILGHSEVAQDLGVVDIERAGKVAGARFYYLKGELVKLNYAIISLAISFLAAKGFILTQPPYMLNRRAISGAVMLSDFQDVIYKIEDEDLYLIGTSEHALAAMHMGEVFDGSQLPLRYAGVSPCFRKEAGAHGKDTKGIFRVHQFEKVEQFVFSKPEDSWVELELMIGNAEEFFQLLELPFRVVVLSSGDTGKVAAKTYDLEVWLPGQQRYREAVSCSNCSDFQARRLGIKYREKPHEQAKFVHTLNSTLVATERAIVAILENFQTEDRRVLIPHALRPYMNGIVEISARGPM